MKKLIGSYHIWRFMMSNFLTRLADASMNPWKSNQIESVQPFRKS